MFELSVNNRNFLWMTRGKSWGFRFLSKCSSLSPVVDAVYKAVFLGDESRFGYWKGVITVDGSKRLYVACRCYDSTMQRDEAGRRIPHEFLLLCSDEEYDLINGLAWESLILDQVRGLYSERYPRCANEVTDCVIDFSVHIDSGIKPSNSCVLLDVSVPPAISPTNRETHSVPRRFPRIFFPILLVCLVVGYIAAKSHRNSFLPISGATGYNVCIGAAPVTNADYSEFVKATGHTVPPYWRDGKVPEGEMKHPVLWVSYEDARAYCDWLGAKDATHTYRLPTKGELGAASVNMPTNAQVDISGDIWVWTLTACAEGTNTAKVALWSSPRNDCRSEDRTSARQTDKGYSDIIFYIVREKATR